MLIYYQKTNSHLCTIIQNGALMCVEALLHPQDPLLQNAQTGPGDKTTHFYPYCDPISSVPPPRVLNIQTPRRKGTIIVT